jgi:hypothetical protein
MRQQSSIESRQRDPAQRQRNAIKLMLYSVSITVSLAVSLSLSAAALAQKPDTAPNCVARIADIERNTPQAGDILKLANALQCPSRKTYVDSDRPAETFLGLGHNLAFVELLYSRGPARSVKPAPASPQSVEPLPTTPAASVWQWLSERPLLLELIAVLVLAAPALWLLQGIARLIWPPLTVHVSLRSMIAAQPPSIEFDEAASVVLRADLALSAFKTPSVKERPE